MREWSAGRLVVLISHADSVRRRTASVEFGAGVVGGTVQGAVSAGIDGEPPHVEQFEVVVPASPWQYAWDLLAAAWTPAVHAVCGQPGWVLVSVAVPDLGAPDQGDFVTFQCARPSGVLLLTSDRLGLPALHVHTSTRLNEGATVLDALNLVYEVLTGRQD